MASSNGDTLQAQECNMYQQWMDLQESELHEILQAIELNFEAKLTDSELTQLIQKTTKNFEDYMEIRSHIAHQDPTPFFAPPWCTTLENSGMWLAGCRPSIFVRLIHALSGLEIESQLAEFLKGVRDANIGHLSQTQLCQVDNIQMKSIREERRLSCKQATLQENMADHPLTEVIKKPEEGCESNPSAHSALDDNGEEMAKLLEEADKLRLETYKELIDILTPLQGVQFIAAIKRLRICTREWGKKRDSDHGRCDHEMKA